MAEYLWDLEPLLALDALIHRLNIPEIGKQEARKLSGETSDWLDAYLKGWKAGAAVAKTPFELKLLLARLPDPTRESLVSSLMLSGYLGLAQSQERMERALVQALVEGAQPEVLEQMFHPHLEGWDTQALQGFGARALRGFGTGGIRAAGGSNAWAVGTQRSHSGQTFLCGDPHLQVNQLPALFLKSEPGLAMIIGLAQPLQDCQELRWVVIARWLGAEPLAWPIMWITPLRRWNNQRSGAKTG